MKTCIILSKEELAEAIGNFVAKQGVTLTGSIQSTINADGSVSIETGQVVGNTAIADDKLNAAKTEIDSVSKNATVEETTEKRVRRSKEQIDAGMSVEQVKSGMTLTEFNGLKTDPIESTTVEDLVEDITDGDTKEEPATTLESETVDDDDSIFG